MEITTAFTDPAREEEGVWTDYRDGSRVKIARLGNNRFARVLDAKMRPYRRLERQDKLDPEIQTRVLCECVAQSLLLDWDGFTKDGKELKYSVDAATGLLLASMDFRNDIVTLADDESKFHAENKEAAEKNS